MQAGVNRGVPAGAGGAAGGPRRCPPARRESITASTTTMTTTTIERRLTMKRLAVAFAVLVSAPAYAAKPMSCESLAGLSLPDTVILSAALRSGRQLRSARGNTADRGRVRDRVQPASQRLGHRLRAVDASERLERQVPLRRRRRLGGRVRSTTAGSAARCCAATPAARAIPGTSAATRTSRPAIRKRSPTSAGAASTCRRRARRT